MQQKTKQEGGQEIEARQTSNLIAIEATKDHFRHSIQSTMLLMM